MRAVGAALDARNTRAVRRALYDHMAAFAAFIRSQIQGESA